MGVLVSGLCWLFLLHASAPVSGGTVNWDELNEQLNGPKKDWAKQTIAKNWAMRPKGFFQGVKEESWQEIIPLLSPAKIARIRREEFQDSGAARRAFAIETPSILANNGLFKKFKWTVYDLLYEYYTLESKRASNSNLDDWIEKIGPHQLAILNLDDGSLVGQPDSRPDRLNIHHGSRGHYDIQVHRLKIERMIGFIPGSWLKQSGHLIMEALVSSNPPLLRHLGGSALVATLKNPNQICKLLNYNALRSLQPAQLRWLKPTCMAVIQNLEDMDLSFQVSFLSEDIFSLYNGPLHHSTISRISSNQLNAFGSLIDDQTLTCSSLELSFLSPAAIQSITASCLYGYLSKPKRQSLGVLWQSIPLSTLMQFTPSMKFVWNNIHKDDFPLMSSVIRSIVCVKPYSSEHYNNLSFSTSLLVQNVSAPWLYELLQSRQNPIKLGHLWQGVSPLIINAFTEEMMTAFGNVDPLDIAQMPSWVLQSFLKSKTALANLSKLTEPIVVSSGVNGVGLTRGTFTTIVEIAPNVAGHLLLHSTDLPYDILADCTGQLIRTLTYIDPGRVKRDWLYIFNTLESSNPMTFSKIVMLISTKSKHHFCSTISSLEEYLSFNWLRSNMNESCLSTLLLDTGDLSIILKAPELFGERPRWKEIVKKYNQQDGADQFLLDRQLASKLGSVCEFWHAISRKKGRTILTIIESETLNVIRPPCILSLGDFLHGNVDLIPFLADDAFSMHQVDELPCKLKNLSIGQLEKLSRDTMINFKVPTAEELTEHALAKVTLEELLELDHRQFKVILEHQWSFILDDVKHAALSQHFNRVTGILNGFVITRKKGWAVHYELDISDKYERLKEFEESLKFFAIAQLNCANLTDSLNWVGLLSAMKSSKARNRLLSLFRQFSWSRPLIFTFARNTKELRLYLHTLMKETEYKGGRIEIQLDRKFGFDRGAIINTLLSSPTLFAGFGAFVKGEGFSDHGGPMRMLVSQVLSDINRDLIVGSSGLQSSDSNPVITTKHYHADKVNDKKKSFIIPSSSKFIWGVSERAGLIFGLILGKALQLDIRLPFELDLEFYSLIICPNDEAVKRYYYIVYGGEKLEFENYVLSSGNSDILVKEQLLNTLTRLDCLRFAMLSLKSCYEDAKYDFEAKTNIRSCGINEGFLDHSQLEDEESRKRYLELHDKRVFEEFKAFIRNVNLGLSYSLHLTEESIKIPPLALRPFVNFISELLNSQPITGAELLERVQFINDQLIGSFIPGQTVLASKVVSSFILNLTMKQIKHLMAIWTGTFTPSLKYTEFKVHFVNLAVTSEPVFLDFKDHEGLKGHDNPIMMIAPGQQYREFLKIIYQELVVVGKDFDTFSSENFKATPLTTIRVSTCLKSFTIALRPAHELLNNLIDLINTPITTIRDADQA